MDREEIKKSFSPGKYRAQDEDRGYYDDEEEEFNDREQYRRERSRGYGSDQDPAAGYGRG